MEVRPRICACQIYSDMSWNVLSQDSWQKTQPRTTSKRGNKGLLKSNEYQIWAINILKSFSRWWFTLSRSLKGSSAQKILLLKSNIVNYSSASVALPILLLLRKIKKLLSLKLSSFFIFFPVLVSFNHSLLILPVFFFLVQCFFFLSIPFLLPRRDTFLREMTNNFGNQEILFDVHCHHKRE